MKSQLRTGVYLSYINLAIGCVIPFFYTPVMLEMLGQAEYGVYSLANSVVGYLSLLNFGFGSTIVRYFSKYRAENKKDALEQTFGFFLILYGILAAVALAVGVSISRNVDLFFKQGLSTQELDTLRPLVLIMAANVALSFPISVFSSVAVSYERYLFRKIVDIVSTILIPVANLLALYLGYASIGMALAGMILQFALAPVNIVYCFKVIKIKPRFARLPSGLVREMMGFSFFVFIGLVVDMLFWATDKVILGMRASSVAVAVYNVGGTFNGIVMSLSTSISGVLIPKVTGMVAAGSDRENWSELFIRVGRVQFLVIGLIVSGFAVFGESFINLWAGPEYMGAYWVAVLTMFPLCIPLIQNTGISFITAQNKHQFRSLVYLCIALLNVVSTYLVVPRFGIIGAAGCSCAAYLLGQGVIMNIYYYKVTGLNIPLFWKNIIKMAVVPAIMMLVGLLLRTVIAIESWEVFLVGVTLFAVIYVGLMYLLAMNNYERDIIREPIRRLCLREKEV